MSCIFISYARENEMLVKSLDAKLSDKGYVVLWDKRIGSGEEWAPSIEDKIKKSSVLIAVITRQVFATHCWVSRELQFATNHGRPIIPVVYCPQKAEEGGQGIGLSIASTNWIRRSEAETSQVANEDLISEIVQAIEKRAIGTGHELAADPVLARDEDALLGSIDDTSCGAEQACKFLALRALRDRRFELVKSLSDSLWGGTEGGLAEELYQWYQWALWYAETAKTATWEDVIVCSKNRPQAVVPDFVRQRFLAEWRRERERAIEAWNRVVVGGETSDDAKAAAAAAVDVFSPRILSVFRSLIGEDRLPTGDFEDRARSVLGDFFHDRGAACSQALLDRLKSVFPPVPAEIEPLRQEWEASDRIREERGHFVAYLDSCAADCPPAAVLARRIRKQPMDHAPDYPTALRSAQIWETALGRILDEGGNPVEALAGTEAISKVFKKAGAFLKRLHDWGEVIRASLELSWRDSISDERGRVEARKWIEERRDAARRLRTMLENGSTPSSTMPLIKRLGVEEEAMAIELALLDVLHVLAFDPLVGADLDVGELGRSLEKLRGLEQGQEGDVLERIVTWRKLAESVLAVVKDIAPPDVASNGHGFRVRVDVKSVCLRMSDMQVAAVVRCFDVRDGTKTMPSIELPSDALLSRLQELWRRYSMAVERVRVGRAELVGRLRESLFEKAIEICETKLAGFFPAAGEVTILLRRWAGAEVCWTAWREDYDAGHWHAARAKLLEAFKAYEVPASLGGLAMIGECLTEISGKRLADLASEQAAIARAEECEGYLKGILRKLEDPGYVPAVDTGKLEDLASVKPANGDVETVPGDLAEGFQTERIPEAIRQLATIVYQLVDEVVELQRQKAELEREEPGVDQHTGLPSELSVLSLEQQRLAGLKNSLDRMESRLEVLRRIPNAGMSLGIVQVARDLHDVRAKRLAELARFRAAVDQVMQVIASAGYDDAVKWKNAFQMLSGFLNSDAGKPFENVGDPLLSAVAIGRDLAESPLRGATEKVQRRLLRQREAHLGHPVLAAMRARKVELEGPLRARLLQSLEGVRVILGSPERADNLVARLMLPRLRETSSLEPLAACVKEIDDKLKVEIQDHERPDLVDPNAELDRLKAAAGGNWGLALAVAGDVSSVAEAMKARQLPPHFFSVAVLAALQARRDPAVKGGEAESSIHVAISALALLAGSADYRAWMKREFEVDLPAEFPVDPSFAERLRSEVQRILEGVGLSWGSVAVPNSWANRWEIECSAVREAQRLPPLPGVDFFPGPELAKVCMPSGFETAVSRNPEVRVWYGQYSPGAAMLRSAGIEAEAALAFLPSVLGNGDQASDAMVLRAEALECLIRRKLVEPSAEPSQLRQMVIDYVDALLLAEDGKLVPRLDALFGLMIQHLQEPHRFLHRSRDIADADLRRACMDAVLEKVAALSRSAKDLNMLKRRRAKLLIVAMGMRFALWAKQGDATNALMTKMMDDVNTAKDDAPLEPSVLIHRLYLLCCRAVTLKDPRLEKPLRDEIKGLASLARRRNWPRSSQEAVGELEELSAMMEDRSQWMRKMFFDRYINQ